MRCQMTVLPSCVSAGESVPAAPTTCGAWLTMRRRAEYENKARQLEDAAMPTARALSPPRLQQISAQ